MFSLRRLSPAAVSVTPWRLSSARATAMFFSATGSGLGAFGSSASRVRRYRRVHRPIGISLSYVRCLPDRGRSKTGLLKRVGGAAQFLDGGLGDLNGLGPLIHFQIVRGGVAGAGAEIFLYDGTFQIQIRGAAHLANGAAVRIH